MECVYIMMRVCVQATRDAEEYVWCVCVPFSDNNTHDTTNKQTVKLYIVQVFHSWNGPDSWKLAVKLCVCVSFHGKMAKLWVVLEFHTFLFEYNRD